MKFNLQENFDWLLATEKELARLKAVVYTYEKGEKVEKARLMKLSMDTTQTARENFAYSHPDYTDYLNKCGQAIEEYETLKLQRETRFAMFEAWRSMEASKRISVEKFR